MKLAIFDIGTRASRIMTGDVEKFKENGFDFKYFRTYAELTELGNGLRETSDGKYEFQMQHLEKTVDFITKHLHILKKKKIEEDSIIAVGTEVFRKPSNWQQLIDMIEQFTGLKINILSPLEEAKTSFYAVAISFAEENIGSGPFVVIEQGGGSIQITVAEAHYDGSITTIGQTSIPELGTLLLRKKFIDFSNENQRVKTVQNDVFDFATRTITTVMDQEFPRIKRGGIFQAYGLGRGITKMRSGSNQKVHGIPIYMDTLTNPIENKFLQSYKNYAIKSLVKDAENFHLPGENLESVYKKLEQFYSQPCYAAVLQYLGLTNIKICGTGLRYGVFFRKAHDEWHDIEEFKG